MTDVRFWPPALLSRHAERHAELDRRAAAAAEEKRLSAQRLEHVRREVVQPLRAAGARNRFADMIRESLKEGHGQ